MSLFNELKRRNVFRVGIAYLVLGWVLLQVADIIVPALNLPPYSMTLILVVMALGFPVALVFAWAFELTPEGIKREKHVDRTQSVTDQTARKLDAVVITLLVIAIGMFGYQSFVVTPPAPDAETVAEIDPDQPVDTRASIAVLPFVNMSSSEENEYFSDGLTETLLHMLAQVKDLRVAARTSSFAFKGSNPDIRDVAAQLNVKTILEGSVQRAGERVRITAQLIDASDGSHIWSQNFDRDLDDIFAIQDEIANAVARALMASLLGETDAASSARAIDSVSTTNLEAYDLYLRGLEQYNTLSYTSLPSAVNLFQQALTLDPGFDEARYDLVKTYNFMVSTGLMSPVDAAARSRGVLAPLLERQPVPIMAQVYEKWREVQALQFQVTAEKWRELETLGLNAIALMPNEATLYNLTANIIGNRFNLNRPADAIALLERGLLVDPLNINMLFQKGRYLIRLDRHQEALDAYARIREIKPSSPNGYYGPALVYADLGQRDQEILWNFRASQVDAKDHELPAAIVRSLLSLGQPEAARAWLAHAELLNANGSDTRLARLEFEAVTGNTARAIELAESEARAHNNNRRGIYVISVWLYLQLMFEQGQIDRALAVLDETFPGILEPGTENVADSFAAAAAIGRVYQVIDADAPTRAKTSEGIIQAWATTGYSIGELWTDIPLLVLQGKDVEAKALLLEILTERNQFTGCWRILLLRNPILQPLFQDPEIQTALQETEAAFVRQAQNYRTMVEKGEIVVPGEQ